MQSIDGTHVGAFLHLFLHLRGQSLRDISFGKFFLLDLDILKEIVRKPEISVFKKLFKTNLPGLPYLHEEIICQITVCR